MLKENKEIFDLIGITAYHKAGKLGQGDKIDIILDNDDTGHSNKVMPLGLEVAPLAPIKFLDRLDMKNSVDWIFANADKIASINCSWHSIARIPEFERLEKLDIPVFAASGNKNDSELPYPSRLPWILSVGAWDLKRNMKEIYSSCGQELDCLIPDNIFWLSGKGEPMTDDGTSFTSPVVPRMLRLTGRDYTRQEAYDFVRVNCKDVLEPGWDLKSGYGLFVLPKLEVDTMGINVPEKIIIHHSLTEDNVVLSSFDAIKRYHMETNGWSDIGYHWLLEKVNNKWIWLPGRGEKVSGAHTKEDGMNYKSIGICVVGNFDKDTPNAELYQLLADKCNLLKSRYPAITAIEGHRKYATYKSCPGNNFKIEEVVKRMEHKESLVGKEIDADAKVIFKGKTIPAGIITVNKQGKTMVELRTIAELLGLKINYDNSTKTSTLS